MNHLLRDGWEYPSPEEIARVRAAIGPTRQELLVMAQSYVEYRTACETMFDRVIEDIELLITNPGDPRMVARAKQLVASLRTLPVPKEKS
jgi:hypothetical protein